MSNIYYVLYIHFSFIFPTAHTNCLFCARLNCRSKTKASDSRFVIKIAEILYIGYENVVYKTQHIVCELNWCFTLVSLLICRSLHFKMVCVSLRVRWRWVLSHIKELALKCITNWNSIASSLFNFFLISFCSLFFFFLLFVVEIDCLLLRGTITILHSPEMINKEIVEIIFAMETGWHF